MSLVDWLTAAGRREVLLHSLHQLLRGHRDGSAYGPVLHSTSPEAYCAPGSMPGVPGDFLGLLALQILLGSDLGPAFSQDSKGSTAPFTGVGRGQ